MSWLQKLYRTYEYVQNQGLDDQDLALPFHMPKAVHLRVVLNDKGQLVDAERFDGKKQIPIQVTEKSLKRAGATIAAHALHDGLQYIAKTAEQYLTIEYLTKVAEKAEKKDGKKWKEFLTATDEEKQNFADKEKEKYQNSFIFYEKQLSDWAQVSNLQEIQIILQYVRQGSLIEDLLSKKVFSFEDNILRSGQDDPFALTIVWAIEVANDSHLSDLHLNSLHTDLWSNNNIKNQWIKYQESQSEQGDKQKEVCYITGEDVYLTEAYPKIDGNAKLISANDTEGFTFRGRFLTDKEAVALGREVSQKAFNILKWLIKRQGIRNGDQIVVAWSINCSDDEDKTLSLLYESEDIYQVLFGEDNINESADLGFKAAEIIKKKLHGYQAKLKVNEQISLLIVVTTKKSTGRMAVTYYQEFLPTDYFNNLDAWVDDFSWYQCYTREMRENKKTVKHTVWPYIPPSPAAWPYIPPSPAAIAQTVYGKALSDNLKKQLYARLLPVISGGNNIPIPFDLVQQSFRAACNPNGCDHWEWQRNIGVACALYKGWRARHRESSQRRNYPMALDKENRSRNYLYGRLIAQAENLEWYALYLQNGKKTPTRATNAERYFQQFARQPYSTWLTIEKSLTSYKNYLTNHGKDFYKQEIGEIMDLFSNNDFTCDDKLEGEFLLGYHCQKMELARQIDEHKAAKQKKTDTNESSNDI